MAAIPIHAVLIGVLRSDISATSVTVRISQLLPVPGAPVTSKKGGNFCLAVPSKTFLKWLYITFITRALSIDSCFWLMKSITLSSKDSNDGAVVRGVLVFRICSVVELCVGFSIILNARSSSNGSVLMGYWLR